ncbi:MAG: caspase family protein [Planctomycetia bacterium]|nr:caspase family protein [Planctomycetia bacterium]
MNAWRHSKWACVVALALSISKLASAAPPSGEQWAVLIAVQKHDEATLNNVQFTINDAQLVRKTLVDRAALASDHILEMTDDSPKELRPTLANLRRELPGFLKKAAAGDRVVIYFSGHGHLEQAGQAYLVPSDFRRDAPAQSALPIAEVRQLLSDCKAGVKFLILDCCHAGGAKDAAGGVAAETLAKSLEPDKVAGCVVLASCKVDENSWEWTQRQHGIFTYWLCRAMEGGGDANGDGQLSFTEVHSYAGERVTTTAEQVLRKPQTPVWLTGGSIEGVPVVLTLRAEPPESVMRRLAEHVDLEIRRQKLKKVGVLEFGTPAGQLAQANLPSICAEEMRKSLARMCGGDYAVLDADAMRQAAKGARVDDVGDPPAMRRLGQQGGGMDAVVWGTVQRGGRKLHVQCFLNSTQSGDRLLAPAGVIPLSEDLLADNGASFDNRERPPGSPYDEQVVMHVSEEAQQAHPLLDNDFPFGVEVHSVLVRPGEQVTDATRRVRKEQVQLYAEKGVQVEPTPTRVVAAREGEIFEIRVKNNLKERVGVTVLVDGINSLGQKRERLGQAWSWVFGAGKEHTIAGWWKPKTPEAKPNDGMINFKLKLFQFVDSPQSVAARQNFSDSIGLITVAFYAERGRRLGVGEGPEEHRQLRTENFQAGRLLGVVQIRYVDEAEFKRLVEGKPAGKRP